MTRISLLALVATAGLASFAAAQEPSAWTPVATQPAQAQPAKVVKAPLYDEKADAKQQIAAALKKAKKENRRVLIQWGFNGCSWCTMMHKTFETDGAIKKELMYEYDLVMVDAGIQNKNMDLAKSYGAEIKGFPFLTVLDADGKVIAHQETDSLEIKNEKGESVQGDGAGHDPAKLLAFMKTNQAKPLIAESVLADARKQAKTEGKRLFLHFGAPWCGWCHKLEDWMAQPEVAKVMAKDFVDVKIDQDRMTGGKELQSKYNKTPSGIPWFAIVDPVTGDAISNSDAPEKGNIGFPSEPHEIAHFVTMLQGAKKNMSDSDIAALKTSLEEGRKH